MAELSQELERQMDEAMATGRDSFDDEVATSCALHRFRKLFLFVLLSGRRIATPREDLQYVADLSTPAAASVELAEDGTVVEWCKANIDFSVKALADGLRGNDTWTKSPTERESPAYAA